MPLSGYLGADFQGDKGFPPLINLLSMIDKYGAYFYFLSKALHFLTRMSEVNTHEEYLKYHKELQALSTGNDVTIQNILDVLTRLDLQVSKLAFMDCDRCVNQQPVDRAAYVKEAGIFDRVLRYELSTKWFKYLSAEQATLYQAVDLFGEVVKNNFPSAKGEIIEAGRCLALERGTAAVFHCMRILEVGLKALATELRVDFDNRNWENVLRDMKWQSKIFLDLRIVPPIGKINYISIQKQQYILDL
jgi:hypothetical protein